MLSECLATICVFVVVPYYSLSLSSLYPFLFTFTFSLWGLVGTLCFSFNGRRSKLLTKQPADDVDSNLTTKPHGIAVESLVSRLAVDLIVSRAYSLPLA